MHQLPRLMRAFRALLLLCAVATFTPAPAHAEGSVSALHMGMGAKSGEMGRFDAIVEQYNASGERFRIDSHCQSACTIFLSIRNVCVTPNATLLFHAGGSPKQARFNPGATQHMLAAYNPVLRQYVLARHFMDTFEFHAISGREMISRFGYRACRGP